MAQAGVGTLHGSHDTHLSEKEVAPHLCQRRSTPQDPPSKAAAIPPSSSFTPGARNLLQLGDGVGVAWEGALGGSGLYHQRRP